MRFQVGCGQFAPRKADVTGNLDRIAELSLQASAEGVDLLVFPECITSGYLVEGGVADVALGSEELAELLGNRLKSLGRPLDLLVGFYEREGGNFYNSAAYLSAKGGVEVVHTYRKFFLPTYGVFDEERFVSRGTGLGVFDTRFGKLGTLICEDVWHSILPTLCSVAGANLLLVPSASPARDFSGETVGNHARYGRMLRSVCEEHGVYCANAQLCGFEGGKGFIGGSRIVDPFGETLVESPIAEDHLLVAEVDLSLLEVARAQLPLLSDLQSAWSNLANLADGLKPTA